MPTDQHAAHLAEQAAVLGRDITRIKQQLDALADQLYPPAGLEGLTPAQAEISPDDRGTLPGQGQVPLAIYAADLFHLDPYNFRTIEAVRELLSRMTGREL